MCLYIILYTYIHTYICKYIHTYIHLISISYSYISPDTYSVVHDARSVTHEQYENRSAHPQSRHLYACCCVKMIFPHGPGFVAKDALRIVTRFSICCIRRTLFVFLVQCFTQFQSYPLGSLATKEL